MRFHVLKIHKTLFFIVVFIFFIFRVMYFLHSNASIGWTPAPRGCSAGVGLSECACVAEAYGVRTKLSKLCNKNCAFSQFCKTFDSVRKGLRTCPPDHQALPLFPKPYQLSHA